VLEILSEREMVVSGSYQKESPRIVITDVETTTLRGLADSTSRRSTTPPPDNTTWSPPVLVRGERTTRLVRRQTITLDGEYEVTGTWRYEAGGTTRAVFVVEPVQDAPLPEDEERSEKKGPSKTDSSQGQAKPTISDWRTWTSADGKHSVEAKLVGYIGGTLTLYYQ
jgi:hypothetical protein